MTHEHDITCQNILENLNTYIDGELGDEICADIEAHIQTCLDCRIVVNTLKKTIELCKYADSESSLPVETRHRLFAKLNLEDYEKKD
ncbi:MAG: zf-HC2 domain-containing protein [Brevefilum sp.]|nr:zf-HC2 domain-containing protein [Brevefilum sp.]MDT8382176.1 zf-HC2 domain-containing protein [Brevefilum sp.]MDW7755459.1 zf-HC2 domain-containing protein [Brevefilum sp.]